MIPIHNANSIAQSDDGDHSKINAKVNFTEITLRMINPCSRCYGAPHPWSRSQGLTA
jgi:hypothetical protein